MNDKIEFKDQKISKDDLNRILEAGMLSPTAKSLQPQKIYVIESEKTLSMIQKLTNCHAPTVLMVCGNIEQCYKQYHYASYRHDCMLVSIHMILEATYLGIDNLYNMDFNLNDELEKEFNLDGNIIPVSLIFLGYKTDNSTGFLASDFSCNLLPKFKKNIEEIIEYI